MRTFTTKDILDVDIDQITLTRDRETNTVRVRANVTVTLVDTLDPTRKTAIGISLNKTVAELSVGPAVNSLRTAVLNALKAQIA